QGGVKVGDPPQQCIPASLGLPPCLAVALLRQRGQPLGGAVGQEGVGQQLEDGAQHFIMTAPHRAIGADGLAVAVPVGAVAAAPPGQNPEGGGAAATAALAQAG